MLFPTDDVILQACQAVFDTLPFTTPKSQADLLNQLARFNGAVHEHLEGLGYGYLNNPLIINQTYEVVEEFLQPICQNTPFAY